MAEPYIANIVGQYQQGQAFGTQQRQEREAEQRQSRLSELASLAYGSQNPEERRSLVGQAVGVDPSAGLALGGSLAKDDENQQMELVKAIRLVGMYPEAQQPEAYRRVVGQLRQRFPGLPIPDEIDDNARKALAAVNAAYGGGESNLSDRYRVVGGALVDLQDPSKPVYVAPIQTDTGLVEGGPQGFRQITLGGPPPAAPAQGAVVTNEQGERGRYSIAEDGRPVFIAEGVSPNIEQGITADPSAFQQPTAEAPAQFIGGQPQGQPILPRGASAEAERLRLAREANARAEQANQRAQEAADRAKRASEAKGAVGKPLTQGVVTDLTKDAGKLENLGNLIATFNDEFAGNVVGGSVENFAGRNLPEFLSPATEGQAEWWQQYDRYKNEVRNELFGASLTAGEQAAFEAADIIPNMAPAVARKNLATQREIIRKGLERKGRTWAAQGYNREAISEATGLDFRQGAQGGAGGGQATPPAAPRARNPQTGQVIELRNGQWVPVDG